MAYKDLVVRDVWTSADADGAPLEIRQLNGDRFVNVTSLFPAITSADAAWQWWSGTHTANYQQPEGHLAAWMGDECTLGNGSTSWHKLTDTVKENSNVELGEPERVYLEQLRSELLHAGYCEGVLTSSVP